ncbi:MAG: hypothetical protein CBD47_08955 [Synechococcus sp. TMED187]|nr:hypothetical protein [Synechococcus sp. NAT40]OUW45308.1 MAG: hypothetical protein CBD47_08955 [Synechococcus sp. TMED187]RZO12860.1 MAG: hypothetical protein EVB08_07035 [Synechococcus sp. MED-G135]
MLHLVRRFAPTTVLLLAAFLSTSALSEHTHDGFHLLVVMGCMLPLQCAALFWAWHRSQQSSNAGWD